MTELNAKKVNDSASGETPKDSTAIVNSWPTWKQSMLGGIGYVLTVTNQQTPSESNTNTNNS